jgi:hypothetical protein
MAPPAKQNNMKENYIGTPPPPNILDLSTNFLNIYELFSNLLCEQLQNTAFTIIILLAYKISFYNSVYKSV